MDGTLACECGTKLSVEDQIDRIACPNCQAAYAVTITRLRNPSATPSTD